MTHDSFALHPQLEADTALICDLDLCRVLLRLDARFPWLILVPQKDHVTDILDLDEPEQLQLMREVVCATTAMKKLFQPDKINIGALGNIVPQLHVHVIARFIADAAWPHPVWSHGEARPYEKSQLGVVKNKLKSAFSLQL